MNDTPLLLSCEILENKELTPLYYLMRLNSPKLANCVKSGQFFHVRVSDRLDIPLRRPFSVFDYNENSVSILYEIVGKGTKVLSLKKHGEELDVLGPLGNGFNINKDIQHAIIIGGGMGVVPLFCLAKEIKKKKEIDIQVFIGANTKYKILCERYFKTIGITPFIATDDGSYGYKGLVTELLRERIKSIDQKPKIIYACGPSKMLEEISKIIKEHNLSGQLSLDTRMGCAIGVCLGCVVKGKDGKYKRVCKDGPVFNADELDWE